MSDKEEKKLEVSDDFIEDSKYVDIELSYKLDTQEEIDSIIVAINQFINTHKKGLGKTGINILGYSYKY